MTMNPTPAPLPVKFLRRRRYSGQWQAWHPCTKAEAERVRGLDSWEVDIRYSPEGVSPIQPAVGGMTDEEIMDAAREHCHDFRWPSSAIAIARAIEAKAATRQTGGVDQAWVDKAMHLAHELAWAYFHRPAEKFTKESEALRAHLLKATGAGTQA